VKCGLVFSNWDGETYSIFCLIRQ